MRLTAEKGRSLGGKPLLGYKIVNQQIVIDEEKAPVVRYIFEQYANGVSKRDIAEVLNKKGLRSSTGKDFTANSFQNMLKNHKYIGEYVYKGEVVAELPAIIGSELFARVQDVIKANARAPGANKAKARYLLQGKLFCGHCGAHMIGMSGTGRHGGIYHYYACTKRRNVQACDKKYEKKDFVEWYVVEQTVQWVLNPPRMGAIADMILAEYENSINAQAIKDFESRLKRVEREIDRCFEMLFEASTQAVKDRANEKALDLDLQKKDIEDELVKLRLLSAVKHEKSDILSWLKTFTTGDVMSAEYRMRIIKLFVQSVWLYDDKVVIYYNLEGGKEIAFIDVENATRDLTNKGSSLDDNGRPCGSKYEPLYIFVKGLLGIVVFRP